MPIEHRNDIKLAIAVPTYNESQNVAKLLPKIKDSLKSTPNLRATVFIIDDNSPDGTSAVAKKINLSLKSKNFSIKVLDRKKKEGLGKAYVYAFKQIIRENFDYIIQMDADLSHNPKYLPSFIKLSEASDFIVGSRYIKGGSTPDWSLYRKLQSRFGNVYSCLFLGTKIHDYTGGYNLYSAKLLKKINLESLQAGGYGFLIELKYLAIRNCKNVAEIGIVFTDRQHGSSKIPKNTIFKNLILVPKLALNRK